MQCSEIPFLLSFLTLPSASSHKFLRANLSLFVYLFINPVSAFFPSSCISGQKCWLLHPPLAFMMYTTCVWLTQLFSFLGLIFLWKVSFSPSLSSFLYKCYIEILLLKQYMAGTLVVSRQIIFQLQKKPAPFIIPAV